MSAKEISMEEYGIQLNKLYRAQQSKLRVYNNTIVNHEQAITEIELKKSWVIDEILNTELIADKLKIDLKGEPDNVPKMHGGSR